MTDVMILTMTAGGGHNAAARALAESFDHVIEMSGDDTGPVEWLDVATMSRRMVQRVFNDNYLKMVDRDPQLYGWMYHRFDRRPGRTRRSLNRGLERWGSRRFRRYLEARNPDVCVCTHFYPAQIALDLRRKGRLNAEVVMVITDYQPHQFWVLDGVDRYSVAHEETGWNLARRGVDPARIHVTGIPIDRKFEHTPERPSVARKLGLDPDRFTVLLAAGGMGVGPLEEVVDELFSMDIPLQIVAVCGKNESLRERLSRKIPPAGTRFLVRGFVTNMQEWMAASDLIVTKSGGLTTSESLATGLPMVVLDPIPGQETRNADFLLERGAAIKALSAASVPYKILHLMGDRTALDRMRQRAQSLGRPFAGQSLAHSILGMEVPMTRAKSA